MFDHRQKRRPGIQSGWRNFAASRHVGHGGARVGGRRAGQAAGGRQGDGLRRADRRRTRAPATRPARGTPSLSAPGASRRCPARPRGTGGCRPRSPSRRRRGPGPARGRRRARRRRPPGRGPSARAARSSARRRGRRSGATRSASSCSTTVASTAASLPKPLTVGRPPCEHGGHRGLVELHDDRGAGYPGADGGDVGGEPFGEGLRQVAAGAGVDDRPVATGALETGGQRPWPGGLHLERSGVAPGDLVEGVEVALAGTRGPPLVHPGRGTSRQPAGVRSTARSTSRAALRPIRSAPAPRPGSSGRCAKSGSSPRRAAAPRRVGAGQGPDAGGRPPRDGDRPRVVVLSVAEATTATLAAAAVARGSRSACRGWPAAGSPRVRLEVATAVSTSTGPVTGFVPFLKAVKLSPPVIRNEFAATRYGVVGSIGGAVQRDRRVGDAVAVRPGQVVGVGEAGVRAQDQLGAARPGGGRGPVPSGSPGTAARGRRRCRRRSG